MTRASDGYLRPITADEAAELFSSFDPFAHILLAVSGGPDSVALMTLARDWAKARGRKAPRFSVATVDHGLRKDAREEAALVARFAKNLRLPHETLVWRGSKPRTGLQEKARAARYDLLITHALAIRADAIALAHHADDQAETVLMRLAAGSGLSGLSGMKPVTQRDGIAILRPFLGHSSARLRATLDARGISYVDDPSNANEMFARIRLRKARAVLEAEGLTVERLQTFSGRMARADEALRFMADKAARQYEMPSETGQIFSPALFEEPSEIIVRVLQTSILKIGTGGDPTLYRLENRILELSRAHSSGKARKLTLGGAILSLSADGRLKILPEPPRRKV